MACASQSNSLLQAVSFDACEIGDTCQAYGELHIARGAPASVAYLEFADGSCVALSLKEEQYRDEELRNTKVQVIGQAHLQPMNDDVINYELVDRWVASGICETGIILYVFQINVTDR